MLLGILYLALAHKVWMLQKRHKVHAARMEELPGSERKGWKSLASGSQVDFQA